MSFSPGDEYYLEIITAVSLFIILLLINAIYKILKGNQSKSWHRTKAIVTHISIKTTSDEDNTLWHKPKIKYSYRVNGKGYISRKYSYKTLESTSYTKLLTKISNIRKGKEIIVYVNPNNPGQAIIERGTNWQNYIELIFFIIFILLIVNSTNKQMHPKRANNQVNSTDMSYDLISRATHIRHFNSAG